MIHQAIRNIYPEVITIRGNSAFDAEDNPVVLDQSLVDAEVARLQAEHDSQEYARNRATAYASTGDQLDMQYWDSVNNTTTWKDHVASVKAQFPKV
jgi:hypothetical protein